MTAYISIQDQIDKAVKTAVAEAEAVAHATGRVNMELAVEEERERIEGELSNLFVCHCLTGWAKRNLHQTGCGQTEAVKSSCSNKKAILAAIRKGLK